MAEKANQAVDRWTSIVDLVNQLAASIVDPFQDRPASQEKQPEIEISNSLSEER